MNQKDTTKLRGVQKRADVCNNTTGYRIALIAINPITNKVETTGDKGVCDFITRNRNQILALPPDDDDLTLEQPSVPLSKMSKVNLRNFCSNMLNKTNGGKKYRSHTVRNQPSWWDNNISPWIEGLQKGGKNLIKEQYIKHIHNCYSHYQVLINDDGDDDDDGVDDFGDGEDMNAEDILPSESPVIQRKSRYQANPTVGQTIPAIPGTSSTQTGDLQPLLTPRGSDSNMPEVPDCFRKVFNIIQFKDM